jgi:hypothetical protein
MADAGASAGGGDVSLEFMSFPTTASLPVAPVVDPAAQAGGGAGGGGAGSLGRSTLDENFSPLSLLSPAFYRACFDVDETDVLSRVRGALWPFRPQHTFLELIAQKPDLYGPVWLSASLVFMIAVGFNMASWLNFRASVAVTPWEYDFKALTKALLYVFGFSFGAPAAVWMGMAYSLPKTVCLGLVSLTCIYGYSISPFIPAAVSVWGGKRARVLAGGGWLGCLFKQALHPTVSSPPSHPLIPLPSPLYPPFPHPPPHSFYASFPAPGYNGPPS